MTRVLEIDQISAVTYLYGMGQSRRHWVIAVVLSTISIAGLSLSAFGDADPWAPESAKPKAADPWATETEAYPPATDSGQGDAAAPSTAEVAALLGTADGLVTPENLRAYVAATRTAVEAAVLARVQQRQDKIMGTVATLLMTLSLVGLLLVFLPLFLRSRYPGRGATLFKYSLIAAVTFVVAVNLFTMTLIVLRAFQGALGGQMNPQVAIVAAIFDTLDSHAEKYAAFAASVFGPVIQQINAGDTSAAVLLLERGQTISADLAAFEPVAYLMRGLHWMFDLAPLALVGVSLLLFAVAAGPVLVEIVKLPARAAAGEVRAGRRVIGVTFRRVGAELLATVCLIGVLFVVSVSVAIFLQLVLGPAIEAFLDYFLIGLLYAQAVEAPSSALIAIALGANAVFLGMLLLTVVVAAILFLAKSHRIFQQRFHLKLSIRAHHFWKRGTLSLLWALALPALFALIAAPIVGSITEALIGEGDDPAWAPIFLVGPVVFVFGFPLAMWLGRGFRAISFLGRSLWQRGAPAPDVRQPPAHPPAAYPA